MKESDKTLRALFQQLETDMSEVRASHSDARQRSSSVSPMNGFSLKSRDSLPTNGLFLNLPGSTTAVNRQELPVAHQQQSLQDPPTIIKSYPLVVEEEEEEEEVEEEDEEDQSDSDSLDDFADTLGGGEEEQEEEEMTVGAGTLGKTNGPASRPSPFLSHYNTAPLLNGKDLDSISAGSRGSQSSGLATVGVTTHPSTHSPSLPRGSKPAISRNLSNDSGVQFCVTDTESTGTTSGQGSTASMQTKPAGAPVEDEKRLSGFADEIFAMLKF